MQAQGLTQETLNALKAMRAAGGVAFKDFTTALGYTSYDLQPLVDRTFPNITPLRNEVPRVAGRGGNSTHWKEIYKINANGLSLGVSERNRNAAVTTQLRDHFAKYAELGFEDFVTWKTDQEAAGLTPEAKAMAVENLLYAALQGEEKILLWGNTGVGPSGAFPAQGGGNGIALGIAPTPVATLVAGGAMTAQATVVFVVALTPEGFFNSSIAGGIPVAQARTNVDGTTDNYGGGSSQVSAASNTITTAAGNLSISAHCAVVKGAAAYAWFAGPVGGGAGGASIVAITTINSVLLTTDPPAHGAPATGFTFLASGASADNSGNGLIFDGYISQSLSGSGLFVSQATGVDGVGTPLTVDAGGNVVEFETDFQYFWDTSRLQPDDVLMSGQDLKNVSEKITKSGAYRINVNGQGSKDGLSGGSLIRSYLGKFAMGGGKEVTLTLHPDMPAGTIFYRTKKLPYRVQGMANIAQIRTQQEWRQIDWAPVHRSWDYGIYANETFEMHFSPAFGVRTNIANG
jgi:hypothetical protein